MSPSFYPGTAVTAPVWATPLSLTTTHGITFCSLFLRVLRCFSSPRSPLLGRCQASSLTGSPIRISGHHWLFAPTPSFSQLVTSFFASESQGIPRTLLLDFLVSSFNCKSFLRLILGRILLDAVSPLMCLFSQYVKGLCASLSGGLADRRESLPRLPYL